MNSADIIILKNAALVLVKLAQQFGGIGVAATETTKLAAEVNRIAFMFEAHQQTKDSGE